MALGNRGVIPTTRAGEGPDFIVLERCLGSLRTLGGSLRRPPLKGRAPLKGSQGLGCLGRRVGGRRISHPLLLCAALEVLPPERPAASKRAVGISQVSRKTRVRTTKRETPKFSSGFRPPRPMEAGQSTELLSQGGWA